MLSLVLWSSLCTYRLSQPSVATLCSLFSPSLKKKIFLFSKFLLFYYLKTVVIMMMLLMTMSIILKDKGILHTIYVSLLYYFLFSLSLTIL